MSVTELTSEVERLRSLLEPLNGESAAIVMKELRRIQEERTKAIANLDAAVAVGNRLAKAAGCLGWTSSERTENIRIAEAATKAWAELGYEDHRTP